MWSFCQLWRSTVEISPFPWLKWASKAYELNPPPPVFRKVQGNLHGWSIWIWFLCMWCIVSRYLHFSNVKIYTPPHLAPPQLAPFTGEGGGVWVGQRLKGDLISPSLTLLILPDSFLDNEATISGDPLTNTSIFWAPRVLVITLILCKLEENGNCLITPISYGSCMMVKKS